MCGSHVSFFFNLQPDESWEGKAPQMTLLVAPLSADELLSIGLTTAASSPPSLKLASVLSRVPLRRRRTEERSTAPSTSMGVITDRQWRSCVHLGDVLRRRYRIEEVGEGGADRVMWLAVVALVRSAGGDDTSAGEDARRRGGRPPPGREVLGSQQGREVRREGRGKE
jgi:hypothetical protein